MMRVAAIALGLVMACSTVAMSQMTIIIPQYSMVCHPKNPVRGPNGTVHQYAPYRVIWDGDATMILNLASAPADSMGNTIRVKRLSKTTVLMRSAVGPHRYAVRLDFQKGFANFDYGRIDRCDPQ